MCPGACPGAGPLGHREPSCGDLSPDADLPPPRDTPRRHSLFPPTPTTRVLTQAQCSPSPQCRPSCTGSRARGTPPPRPPPPAPWTRPPPQPPPTRPANRFAPLLVSGHGPFPPSFSSAFSSQNLRVVRYYVFFLETTTNFLIQNTVFADTTGRMLMHRPCTVGSRSRAKRSRECPSAMSRDGPKGWIFSSQKVDDHRIRQMG